MSQSTELTTRDVLSQVDRRLTRLEDDLRAFQERVEQRFAALEAKFEERCTALEAKVDRNFRWTTGLVFASWLSIMTKLYLG